MNQAERLERPPLYVTIPLWIILGLNIVLNLSGAGLIVSYLVSAKTPNFTSTILPILSVIFTLLSAVGTGLMRRWAAIVFVVLTVIGMLPLCTVEVHVFRVDNATGVVDLVSPLQGMQTYNEAIAKYWAALYVRSREGYMADAAPLAFRTVSLMSSDKEQTRFAEFYAPRNPQSPQVVYGKDGRAEVTVKSITFPQKGLALVRFSRTVTKTGDRQASHWVATLSHDYASGAMAESDRAINPLGFVVNDYRVDPEAP